jgi:hypothetical protein
VLRSEGAHDPRRACRFTAAGRDPIRRCCHERIYGDDGLLHYVAFRLSTPPI